MGNIGPNFRPPNQQRQPSPSGRSPENASQGNTTAPASETSAYGNASAGNAGILSAFASPSGAGLMSLSPLFANGLLLNPMQMALLLRNLLQMPKEMVQLLALLSNIDQAATPELLKQLLQENPEIPLEQLQAFLARRLDKCQDKLLKLLQSTPMGLAGATQETGELLNTLTHLISKTGHSPAEALHTAFTLYLPYYPLQAPQRFSLHFEPPSPDEEGGGASGENTQLVVYIETITLGTFRATLGMAHSVQLQALIQHDAVALAVIPDIESKMRGALSSEGLPAPELIFQLRQKPSLQQDTMLQNISVDRANAESPTRQSVGIHPAGGVSALTIQLAYWLIRIILEIDNRISMTS